MHLQQLKSRRHFRSHCSIGKSSRAKRKDQKYLLLGSRFAAPIETGQRIDPHVIDRADSDVLLPLRFVRGDGIGCRIISEEAGIEPVTDDEGQFVIHGALEDAYCLLMSGAKDALSVHLAKRI